MKEKLCAIKNALTKKKIICDVANGITFKKL